MKRPDHIPEFIQKALGNGQPEVLEQNEIVANLLPDRNHMSVKRHESFPVDEAVIREVGRVTNLAAFVSGLIENDLMRLSETVPVEIENMRIEGRNPVERLAIERAPYIVRAGQHRMLELIDTGSGVDGGAVYPVPVIGNVPATRQAMGIASETFIAFGEGALAAAFIPPFDDYSLEDFGGIYDVGMMSVFRKVQGLRYYATARHMPLLLER